MFILSLMMKNTILVSKIFFLVSFQLSAMGSNNPQIRDPETVEYVDLNRYMGLWYEVARFDQSFQKGCVGVTAEYRLRDDGKVDVLNSCFQDSLEGERRQAKGRAYVKDKTSQAKLRVSFFWPFYGDYWIFDLGENYEYAVVGSPDRDALWFLSRSPRLDPLIYEKLTQKMKEAGFDMSRLQPTEQAF